MTQELLNIIWAAVGTIITALAGWGTTVLVNWLNSKIKDENLRKHATAVTTIVSGAVQAVFQDFVEVLKKNGKFDEAAQKEAKERAITIINSQLTEELKKYIETNFGDITTWISNQIESTIYSLKK